MGGPAAGKTTAVEEQIRARFLAAPKDTAALEMTGWTWILSSQDVNSQFTSGLLDFMSESWTS
jgi:hypothetical protein